MSSSCLNHIIDYFRLCVCPSCFDILSPCCTHGAFIFLSLFLPFLSFTFPLPLSLSLYMVIAFVYKIGRDSRSNAGTGEEGRRWGEGREGGLRYNVNILVEKCQQHRQPIKREEEGEEKGRERERWHTHTHTIYSINMIDHTKCHTHTHTPTHIVK